MTGEDLVAMTTAQYEAMSDEELLAFVKPLLESTRPKVVTEEPPKKAKKPKPLSLLEQALALLEEVNKEKEKNEHP